MMNRKEHWENVSVAKSVKQMSGFREQPENSWPGSHDRNVLVC
jgi:hypothetical protein